MAQVRITSANFEEEVINSTLPVLVDFSATWCGPCRMIAPFVEQISDEYSDSLKVGAVDIDEEHELAVLLRVSSIPTLMLFRGGKLESTLVGYHSKEDILAMIK